MQNFIFGEGTENQTYEQLQRRRAIIERLGQQATSQTPQNLGQGINAIGQALFSRMGDRRLAPQEDAERTRASEAFNAIVGQLGGGMPTAMPPAMPQQEPPAMPVPPPPPWPANPRSASRRLCRCPSWSTVLHCRASPCQGR